MARHKMRYFNGTQELDRVQYMAANHFAALDADPCKFPTEPADWSDRVQIGYLPRAPHAPTTWEHLRPLKVLRTVKVIATKDPHICDWRCEGAYKHSECRCSCGGRNHGIKCEPA